MRDSPLYAYLAGVGRDVAALLDGVKEWGEQVRIVVGPLVLQHRDHALKTHPSVDVLIR